MPKPHGYPESPRTLGEHIKKRRMDLGLLQREVAKRVGTHEATVTIWEAGRTAPTLRWMPWIIDFLEYSPYAQQESFEDWFETVRRSMGVSKAKVARAMGVDPGTLTGWLRGEGRPPADLRERARRALAAAAGSGLAS